MILRVSDARPSNHLTDDDLLERIGALTMRLRHLNRDDPRARAIERTLLSHVADVTARFRARATAIGVRLAAPFERLRRWH
jgi:hypothetical protein